MNKTLLKKIVGTTSFALGAVATFATTEHVGWLQSMLPHNSTVSLVLGILILVGNIWGKHPGSSPSVADAVNDGTLVVDAGRAASVGVTQ